MRTHEDPHNLSPRAECLADLHYPNIRTAKDVLVSHEYVLGEIASWAIKQSPYLYPDGLEGVLVQFSALAGDRCNETFADIDALESWLSRKLREIPEYRAWNDRKTGGDAPSKFVSRHDAPGDPDSDFIDLDALERNIAKSLTMDFVLL